MTHVLTRGTRVRVVVPEGSSDKVREIHDGRTGEVIADSRWATADVEVRLDDSISGGPWHAHYPAHWLDVIPDTGDAESDTERGF